MPNTQFENLIRSIRPTRKDPQNDLSLQVLGILRAVRNLRITRASLIEQMTREYGFDGPLTSGVEQTHWPEDIKDILRTNAREIATGTDDALKIWLRSGRRSHTFWSILPLFRVDGSRY